MVVGKFLAKIDTSVEIIVNANGLKADLRITQVWVTFRKITKKQFDIRCASWHNTMVNWCQLQEMYHNGMARQKHNITILA